MKKTLLYGALGGVALYLFMRSKKKASTNAVVSDEGKSAEQKSTSVQANTKPLTTKKDSILNKIKDLPTINKVAKPVSSILIKKPKEEKPPKFGDPIGKPKEEKPPKLGDPRGKGDFFGDDIPRDPKTGRPKGMPLPPPPPAKVITPLRDGNAVREMDEPRTPPAPTVEPVLPSFVDQRKFYTPREPRKPKVIEFGDPRGKFNDREDFYGGSRPTDRRGKPIGMKKPVLSSPAPPEVRKVISLPKPSKEVPLMIHLLEL